MTKKGRTFNDQEYINGKVPVYLEQNEDKFDFSDKAILCDPTTVKMIGFIK